MGLAIKLNVMLKIWGVICVVDSLKAAVAGKFFHDKIIKL